MVVPVILIGNFVFDRVRVPLLLEPDNCFNEVNGHILDISQYYPDLSVNHAL